MKFESLHHVLHEIAKCKDPARIVGNSEFRRAWQITEAAKDLQQQLCNAPDPHPRWVENRRNRHIFNEGVAAEGMSLIESAAAWYEYEEGRRLCFVAVDSRFRQGRQIVTPLMEPVVEENGQWDQNEFFRSLSIGFDRSEVVRFLDATRIPHGFGDHDHGIAGVETGDLARAFDGIQWVARDWTHKLGKKDLVWVNGARLKKGAQGLKQARQTWDPVKLAKAVLKQHEIDPRVFDVAFDLPALKAWKEQWEKARSELLLKYTGKYPGPSLWPRATPRRHGK
ncbi:hypothetical protein [Paraburkholderia saeva]|uniref:Uncharacterized protein n=1 Tax=Paraburkholderia saeva TaxID=2777537 RepID=A0A9N8RSE7_9BURK|nr:hypothetical protein [Paraburkholderia saeva]CAG4886709.1 hypothetical protein R70241_00243 [Paraburkholderia saeva]CAG4887234.1 hypothetical protein LMG31841_00375 [Paraburkholderia saeva]